MTTAPNRSPAVTILIGVLVIGVGLQTAQTLYRANWEREWREQFEQMNLIQANIEQLTANRQPDTRAVLVQTDALEEAMDDLRESFKPDLLPWWVQDAAAIGTAISALALLVVWLRRRAAQQQTPTASA